MCKQLDSLNKGFHDLHVFKASKNFNPKYYLSDEEVFLAMS